VSFSVEFVALVISFLLDVVICWSTHGFFSLSVFSSLRTQSTAKSNAESSRHLVTVSIEFTAPNDTLASEFNGAVVSEIRNAIVAGTFTRD
jgi:hypothetical protein